MSFQRRLTINCPQTVGDGGDWYRKLEGGVFMIKGMGVCECVGVQLSRTRLIFN